MKRGLPIHPEIGNAVDRTLRESGPPRLENGVAIDVEAIARDYCKFDVAVVDGLVVDGRALLAAYIPQLRAIIAEGRCHPNRQRFSLAHELGHAQLEDDFGDADSLFGSQPRTAFSCEPGDMSPRPEDERSKGRRRRLEIRANQFAALLLMPTGLVKQVWEKHHDPQRCSHMLGVSKLAIEYRLQALNLGSATFDRESSRLAY